MAVQTHNDTVMTGNLTALAEENAEKEVTAVHFYLCVVVCVYGGQLLLVSKGKPGEKKKKPNKKNQNSPDLRGLVASYTLSFPGPTQGRST